MEADEAVKRLGGALRDDRLVVLIGSAASATSQDTTGREYRGLRTPKELVSYIAKRKKYVDESWDLITACSEIATRESRSDLENILISEYRVADNFQTPPAHRILAWLPFSAYLTSNYDEFIERELERVQRRTSVVVTNDDVARIRRVSTPVIKYHGCVSRPRTLVATNDDLAKLHSERNLVGQLISVNLASRNLLVIGHGLADKDLQSLLDALLKDLKDYLPTIYVVREPSTRGGHLSISARHEVIYEDLTQFLNRLLHQYRTREYDTGMGVDFDEAWLDSAFFAGLRQASVLPSETQVLDAFLSHLLDELVARNDVQSVRRDASIAIDLALDERPNFKALRKLWDGIDRSLDAAGDDMIAGESTINAVIESRDQKKSHFRNLGRNLIEENQRILIFSQSQRVLQALKGVTKTVQGTCDLVIAECRPKSPYPYEDAAAICRELSQTNYLISVCPDVVAIDLLAIGQIDKIIMGTHSIYVNEDGEPYAFVNTCGSLAITLAAEQYKIPVIVIGEKLKLEVVAPKFADDTLYRHEEHDLQATALSLVELSTRRGAIRHTNIGYDLIQVSPMIKIEIPDALESA